MAFARTSAFALLALLLPGCVYSWGSAGHRVTADIAARHLSTQASAAVGSDLHAYDGLYKPRDVSDASVWADEVKASVKAFNTWHYIDTAFCLDNSIQKCPPVCGDSVNLVWALEEAAAVLRSPSSDAWSRGMMLRFLLHLVGDLHQPLHTISLFSKQFPNGDKGGNSVVLAPSVRVGSSSTTELHAFWDEGCGASGLERVASSDDSVDALAAELDGNDLEEMASEPIGSTAAMSALIKSWAAESHAIAINTTYSAELLGALGGGESVDTTSEWWGAYAQTASGQVRDRLRLGGARMARMLNALYEGHGHGEGVASSHDTS